MKTKRQKDELIEQAATAVKIYQRMVIDADTERKQTPQKTVDGKTANLSVVAAGGNDGMVAENGVEFVSTATSVY